MSNQTHKHKKLKLLMLLALSLLLVSLFGLAVGAGTPVVAAAPVEPPATLKAVVRPPAQEGDDDQDDEATVEVPAVNPVEAAEDMRVLFEEMTLVQLLWEEYAFAKTACAGNGLNNIQPLAEGPMVLIPNAGDLSLDGSNVSIKLSSDGEITFIPRTQGHRIRVPVDVGDKLAGEEVLSLSFDEARQLMAAGKLIWTAKEHGPYGNGHGLPGHIADCDPLFNEEQFKKTSRK